MTASSRLIRLNALPARMQRNITNVEKPTVVQAALEALLPKENAPDFRLNCFTRRYCPATPIGTGSKKAIKTVEFENGSSPERVA